MNECYPSTIREEELKNRVAADFFGRYDCTRIVGNIDFCVSAKARDTNQMTFMPEEPLFWAKTKTSVRQLRFSGGLSCTELGVLSALLRALTEEEAIAHACVSKSRYHEVKKHLLEIIVLPPRTGIRKKSKKRCWSLRENDRYDTMCGVDGKVYFSVHFEGFILGKIRYFPPLLAVMFSSKRPVNAKSA